MLESLRSQFNRDRYSWLERQEQSQTNDDRFPYKLQAKILTAMVYCPTALDHFTTHSQSKSLSPQDTLEYLALIDQGHVVLRCTSLSELKCLAIRKVSRTIPFEPARRSDENTMHSSRELAVLVFTCSIFAR